MGLDWIVLDKPREHKKDVYDQISKQIDELEQDDYDELIMEELVSKLKEVSISKYETLKCPKVGDNEDTVLYFIKNMYPYTKIRYNTNILISLSAFSRSFLESFSSFTFFIAYSNPSEILKTQ